MKHYSLWVAVAIFLSCSGQENNNQIAGKNQLKDSVDNAIVFNNTTDTLRSLMAQFNTSRVLVGLFFIHNKIKDLISSQIDTSQLLYCSIELLVEKKVDHDKSLIVEINSQLSKMPPATRSQIFKSLEQWLKNDILLSSVLNGNLNEEVFFEQLIYQIPETKDILTAYLKSPDQYWGSLDANQSCKLYYDVNLYLINLKPEERLIFFKKYFDEACDISIKSIQPNVPTN